MTDRRSTRLAQLASTALVCGSMIVASTAWAQGDSPKDDEKNPQNVAKDARDDANDAVDKAVEDAKARAKDAVDRGKAAAKDATNRAKKSAEGAVDRAESATEEALDRADRAREQAEERADNARDKGREVSERARERAEEFGDRAREGAKHARERAREFSRKQFGPDSIRSADIGIWFDRSANDGLVISDVNAKGAMAKLGFREGDRVLSVNGRKVTRDTDFIQHLLADDVRNNKVEVVVVRDGSNTTIYVEPNALRDEYYKEEHDPLQHFGVVLDDRYDDRVVVWKVIPRSPAFYAGIRDGDVITKFRGDRVAAMRDFVQAVSGIQPGPVEVSVDRQKRSREFEVDIPRFAERTDRRDSFREERGERREEAREDRREEGRDGRRDEGREDRREENRREDRREGRDEVRR